MKTFEKGQYLLPGSYQLEILRCVLKERHLDFLNSEVGYFIAEFKVLESDNPEIPVGSTCGWLHRMQDPATSVAALMQFFLATTFDQFQGLEDVIEGLEKVIEAATSEENVLKGEIVKAERKDHTSDLVFFKGDK